MLPSVLCRHRAAWQLDLFDYSAMVMTLTAVVASMAFGATRMRARLVPDWSGAPARLAEAVLGVSALLVALQIVGIAGALTTWPAIATCIAVGLGMAVLGRPSVPRPAATRRIPQAAVIGAVSVALLLLFLWAGPVLTSLHRGMTNGDTVWYHMPFAVRFVQDASITGLQFTGGSYLTWFYPANCELVHSFGILLAGHTDVLSPDISLAWLALALLAAWCVGRPYGAGALSVAALALLLGSRLIVEREPGMAHTDVAGIAFLLAAAAVLVSGERASRLDGGCLAIAALAAGLAVGTKLTLLPPIAVISIAVVVWSRGWRLKAGAIWLGCLTLTGGFWYLRNLVHAGNPLPWIKLGVGPVVLAPADPDFGGAPRGTVLHYVTDLTVWRHFFLPELHDAFGVLWPLVFALAAAGVLWALARGSGIQRILGLAAAAAALAYIVDPLSAAGPEGAPTTFESNLRYLGPALALGLVLMPTLLGFRAWGRWLLFAALAAMLLVTGYPLELGGSRLGGAALLVAIAAGLALAVLLVGKRRSAGLAIAVASSAVLLLFGWPAAHDYVRDRYRGPTDPKLESLHMDAAYRWASRMSDRRIATTSILQYGLYGDHLSNVVRYVGVQGPRGTYTEPTTCRGWREALDAGGFDFLVLAPEYEGSAPAVPPGWVRSANARPILRADPTTVFKLTGRLRPSGCRGNRPS